MVITVVPYSPEWPVQFERVADDLRRVLGDVPIVAIEHVGSTSVPGLAAKPVIDIDVIVQRGDVAAAISALVAAGYTHRGDLGVSTRRNNSIHAIAQWQRFKDSPDPLVRDEWVTRYRLEWRTHF